MKLWIDTETFSETPIKHGTYRYTSDAEVMIVAWAVDDGPVHVEDLTEARTLSAEFYAAAVRTDEIVAHNAMFDRNVMRIGPLEKWRCTMVKAMSHSLPGSLDKLCEILGVAQDKAKHKEGKDLVRLFCMPRPKTSKIRRATRETHPAEWQRFLAYAGNDIEAMRAVDKKLPAWNYQGAELALWHLDQRINDRGFAVDIDLARSATDAIDREQMRLAQAAHAHTDGAVNAATQRDTLLEYILAQYNIALDDLKGSTVDRLLADDSLPVAFHDLLRIRQQASTTSTSKYRAIINGATDGRLRGTLQFNGAGRTGRWAGRTFQPQNLPRPALDNDEIDSGIVAIKNGVADLITDNVMKLCSSAIRGCIIAPPGRKLVVADLSNIEGRMLAWLAGEEWKLHAFRDFDAGTGHDLYKLAYAKAFKIAPEAVTKDQRQVGKVMELALGYEGGVGAFLTFAAAYRIDLEAMAATARDTLPEDLRAKAADFHAWTEKEKRSTFGLSREAFITCDVFKRGWRQGHPNVASLWKELEQTCITAVESPGMTLTCGRFKVRRDGAWLRVGLPSGRALCYPMPRVDEGKLTYMGTNQYTRQWTRLKTYGGKLAENATQAAARDVLAGSMHSIEASGYAIVLTVHDEIITETPDEAAFNVPRLSELMSTPPSWAPDLPLAAAGFDSPRYKKE